MGVTGTDGDSTDGADGESTEKRENECPLTDSTLCKFFSSYLSFSKTDSDELLLLPETKR